MARNEEGNITSRKVREAIREDGNLKGIALFVKERNIYIFVFSDGFIYPVMFIHNLNTLTIDGWLNEARYAEKARLKNREFWGLKEGENYGELYKCKK
jgi:hypothetical protein